MYRKAPQVCYFGHLIRPHPIFDYICFSAFPLLHHSNKTGRARLGPNMALSLQILMRVGSEITPRQTAG